MNGWFPQINAFGEIASGAGEIFVNGISLGPGHGPHWLTDNEIIFNAGTETALVNVRTGVRRTVPVAYNHLSAGNDVWWGFFQTATPRLDAYHSVNRVASLNGTGHAMISRDGRRSVYVQPFHAQHRELVLNAYGPIATGQIMDYSVCNDAVVWNGHPGNTSDPHARIVRGIRWGGTEQNVQVLDWEGPIVTEGPDVPWILSITQTGLILRPWGETWGYQWTGEFFNPCIRFLDGRFMVASSSSRGELQVMHVDPHSSRVDLTQPPPKPPDPEPEPEPPMIPNWNDFYTYMEQRWAVLSKDAASVDRIVREYHHGTAPATAAHPSFGFLKKEGGTNYAGHSEDWILERLSDGSVWGADTVVALGAPHASISRNGPTPEPNPQNWMQPPPLNGEQPPPSGDLEARVAELEQQVNYLMAHQVTLPKKIALRSGTDPNLPEHLRGKVFCLDSTKSDEGLGYFNRDNPGPWETFDFIIVE